MSCSCVYFRIIYFVLGLDVSRFTEDEFCETRKLWNIFKLLLIKMFFLLLWCSFSFLDLLLVTWMLILKCLIVNFAIMLKGILLVWTFLASHWHRNRTHYRYSKNKLKLVTTLCKPNRWQELNGIENMKLCERQKNLTWLHKIIVMSIF